MVSKVFAIKKEAEESLAKELHTAANMNSGIPKHGEAFNQIDRNGNNINTYYTSNELVGYGMMGTGLSMTGIAAADN